MSEKVNIILKNIIDIKIPFLIIVGKYIYYFYTVKIKSRLLKVFPIEVNVPQECGHNKLVVIQLSKLRNIQLWRDQKSIDAIKAIVLSLSQLEHCTMGKCIGVGWLQKCISAIIFLFRKTLFCQYLKKNSMDFQFSCS